MGSAITLERGGWLWGTPGKGRPGLVVQKSKIRRSLKTQRQGCPCLLTRAPLHSLVYAPPGTRCDIYTPRILPEEGFLYTPEPCPKGVLTNTSSPSLLSAPRENPRPLAGVRDGKDSRVLWNPRQRLKLPTLPWVFWRLSLALIHLNERLLRHYCVRRAARLLVL